MAYSSGRGGAGGSFGGSADKNGNGIPDNKEFKPGQKPGAGLRAPVQRSGVNPYFSGLENGDVTWGMPQAGQRTPLQGVLGSLINPLRQGQNFVGDLFDWSSSPADRVGTGWGDRTFGVQKNYYNDIGKDINKYRPASGVTGGIRAALSQSGQGPQQGQDPQSSMSFLDALQQAAGMIPGGSMISRVNYDPQRQAARDNASEADARLGAMYRQLQDSITADQPGIQAAYQQAIDNTNTNSQAAQQAVQGATDSASARNQGVLAALGIGDANQQIIGQGRDVNSATANTMADMAAAQQADANALTQNQATAVQQNRSIGSAAGLEGNLQRAQNQAKLQALLGQIGVAEQDKNASIDAQNAQAGSGAFSQAMSLAGQLYGSSQDAQSRNDQMQLQAMKMAQSQNSSKDLGSYLKALGINPADVAADPAKYGSLLSALSKYNVTQ